MKKSLYFPLIILLISLSLSFVIVKQYVQTQENHQVSIRTISHNTNCMVSRKSITLVKGQVVHARSKWNFKTYLPDYKCFVPSSSIT